MYMTQGMLWADPGSRKGPDGTKKMIYSEADTGSDCQGSDPFSGFWEGGVNDNEKYRNN